LTLPPQSGSAEETWRVRRGNNLAVRGEILPKFRIVAFYGCPPVAKMGILGQFDKDRTIAKLRECAAGFAQLDPSRPVMPCFEIVAVVAQRLPGADGAYRLRTAASVLDEWADFAAANDALLILDVQPGRSRLADEIDSLHPWLRQSHVHLALDPEWAMEEGQAPGSRIGSLGAATISAAQTQLQRLVVDYCLPAKILIVHQFRRQMIRNKDELRSVPEVQLVINFDGIGTPLDKIRGYVALVYDEPVGFAGIKLFFSQDKPVLTPRVVVRLLPSPDVVIYQ
jgi:hypothetical protein